MRITKIERTGTLAWSPNATLLAVGTAAGALDASFSSQTSLEIFNLSLEGVRPELKLTASVPSAARYNRLSWGVGGGEMGIVAGGREDGKVEIWDIATMTEGSKQPAFITTSQSHSGPVRGVNFNPIHTHLLATGSTDGEISIWDINNPSVPTSPGHRSQKMDDVTVLQWNKQVPHILATGSSNGYTVIWDLRTKKELLKLSNNGKRIVTSLAWSPTLVFII